MKKSAVRAAVEAAEERGEARVQSCHKEMWNFYLVLTTLSLLNRAACPRDHVAHAWCRPNRKIRATW